MSVADFPAVRAKRLPIKPRLAGDDLAQIGHPELLLSNALGRLRTAATEVANLKPGRPGEVDAVQEVLLAFRGCEWARMVSCDDDGA